MKIVTVVGARPQFIKAAVVSRQLRKYHTEVLIHTGQHYDYNMSGQFFDELDIPKPDYNLGISGGTHGQMTGEMLKRIEDVLLTENPDMVLLYGDTNSTVAASLAAVKLHIPVCHVESGNRLGTLSNPEEVNRIVTDSISTLKLACTQSSLDNLIRENKGDGAYLVGDPMYDAFCYYASGKASELHEKLTSLDGNEIVLPERFYYLTCHREENTVDEKNMQEILGAANALDAPCIYPVHPRNHAKALDLKQRLGLENVLMCNPVGYLASIYLESHCEKIVTDSGGVQREAFFAKKQCVTVFDYVAWPETMINGCNRLAQPQKDDILNKLSQPCSFPENETAFGDGHAAEKIVDVINTKLNSFTTV